LKRLLLIFFIFLTLKNFATHIVGGEMIYDQIGKDAGGNNIYRITLKIYRDCFNGLAAFDGIDGTAYITVRDAAGALAGIHDIGSPVITNIPPSINSPCVQTPNNVCVEEGVYTYTLTLPPKAGGYYVIYQRCCRNNSILNITQPGAQGSTYYARIPGPEEAITNSSPRFNKFPPIFLCSDINFIFDHSATDPDGDQLVYSFSVPYNGLDGCCPILNGGSPNATACVSPPATCPTSALPPPYPAVNYVSPYSSSYPIASNPSVAIDPATGKLSGRPNLMGQYVVSICVKEYRAGVLLSTHYRDFQFNISSCIVQVIADVADQEKKCMGSSITFTNLSQGNSGALTFHWDFGVPTIGNDTSNAVNPTYTYQDTGKYTVTLIGNPGKPCSDTIRKDFYVYPPLNTTFAHPPTQCFKNNSFNFNATGTHLSDATFDWFFTALATPSTATGKNVSSVKFSEPGKFVVSLVSRQLSCADSTADTVRIIKPPKAQFEVQPYELCDPATVKFTNKSESEEPISYQWTFSNGNTSTLAEPQVVFSPAGSYFVQLTATSAGLCPESSIASLSDVMVFPKPISTFSISPNETTIFDPVINIKTLTSDAIYYTYKFGDGNSSNFINGYHIYQDPGTYEIVQLITNGYGCSDSSIQTVNILPEYRFWIPNAFSPDENRVNDLYRPVAIGVTHYDFEIFDRWGHRVFKTSNPVEGWDGKYKGVDCKQDIYVWKISFKNVVNNNTVYRTGHVTLLRNP
jgi:gliding motility-associated-like protein